MKTHREKELWHHSQDTRASEVHPAFLLITFFGLSRFRVIFLVILSFNPSTNLDFFIAGSFFTILSGFKLCEWSRRLCLIFPMRLRHC